MPTRAIQRPLVAFLIGLLAVSPAWAEDAGQEDLDKAIETKLSAESFRELGAVAELCQSALAKGLSKENAAFAKQLLASTLYKRAEFVSEPIVEGRNVDNQGIQRWQLAVSELQEALKANPDLAPAQLLMGKLQLMPLGNAKLAKAALDQAVKLLKEEPAERFGRQLELAEALRLRASAQSEKDKKLADLNQSIELASDNPQTLRDRGNVYIALNKPQEALADFAAAIKLDPDDAAAHEAAGLAYAMLEKWDEARASLTKAAELDPDSPVPLVQRGRVSFLAGDRRQAIEDVSHALQISPGFMFALLLRGQLYAQGEEWDKALADAEQLIALAPGSADALRLWAAAVANTKKTDEVLPQLERMHDLTPDDSSLSLRLALLYGAKNESQRAIDAYSQTIAGEPQNWFAYQGRADTYLNLGKQDKALEDYEQALKLDPANSGVLNNLAWLLATSPEDQLRNGKRAIELATKACEVTDYKQAHILSTLASAYAETGDFDTAKKWSSKAVELGEGSMKEQLAKELESYEHRKPWREAHPAAPASETKEKVKTAAKEKQSE
ncbi:MAG TPA: tetratricopeptide repeat protein [Pirellulales bacterium]|nr:tetratricopeptide repeat protein [Pirellulales bacterium]